MDNLVTGTPSHLVVDAVSYTELGLDFTVMATEQLMDSKMDAYRTAITWLHLEDVQFRHKQNYLICDTSLGKPGPIMPLSWRQTF